MTEALLDRADKLAASFVYPDKYTKFKTRFAMFDFHDEEEYQKFKESASIAMAAAGKSGSKNHIFDRLEYHPRLEYEWNNKYLPIKPMYFNRVEYGHQLDSYNQDDIHAYVVKSYKFNIFYPDIVDKRKLQYFIEYDKDNTETCRLRIHAGTPYQDIAFTIVKTVGWGRGDRG
ncbi:hypothetical protein LIER_31535 [Lithospermum erythrorhizon]|uniref:Splicing factor Cactin C-terminal domain-containing protein n=1 Tax=Lithospermum erythrorhizon TaxID=34254 RepID=A0AAV3RVA0_LITER